MLCAPRARVPLPCAAPLPCARGVHILLSPELGADAQVVLTVQRLVGSDLGRVHVHVALALPVQCLVGPIPGRAHVHVALAKALAT